MVAQERLLACNTEHSKIAPTQNSFICLLQTNALVFTQERLSSNWTKRPSLLSYFKITSDDRHWTAQSGKTQL